MVCTLNRRRHDGVPHQHAAPTHGHGPRVEPPGRLASGQDADHDRDRNGQDRQQFPPVGQQQEHDREAPAPPAGDRQIAPVHRARDRRAARRSATPARAARAARGRRACAVRSNGKTVRLLVFVRPDAGDLDLQAAQPERRLRRPPRRSAPPGSGPPERIPTACSAVPDRAQRVAVADQRELVQPQGGQHDADDDRRHHDDHQRGDASRAARWCPARSPWSARAGSRRTGSRRRARPRRSAESVLFVIGRDQHAAGVERRDHLRLAVPAGDCRLPREKPLPQFASPGGRGGRWRRAAASARRRAPRPPVRHQFVHPARGQAAERDQRSVTVARRLDLQAPDVRPVAARSCGTR